METNQNSQETTSRRVSYSQYSIWSTCPHQWKLAYHDKLKPEDDSIHLIFGTAIHEAIQEWMDRLFNGTKVQAKHFDTGTFFKDRLFALFKEKIKVDADGNKTFLCDQDTLKEFYLDGLAILDHVQKYQKEFFPTAGAELVGCEVPLEVHLRQGIQFVGYLDLVIRYPRQKKIIIYDFKTSKRGWYHEKKDPKKINQLLLYKSFYSEIFNVPQEQIEVQFIILKRKV